jgi:kynureninase
MKNHFETNPEFARKLDENDSLSDFRNQFYIDDDKTIYLDGNSLGRLPLKNQNADCRSS